MTMLIAGEAARSQHPCTRSRPPNLVAREITGRTYLSHSQFSCMRACPRLFSFRYVERAAADFVPSGLLFGACIHSALEHHFLALRNGRQSAHALLVGAYDAAWRRKASAAESGAPVRFNEGESADTLHALADRMLAAFLDSPVSRPEGQIAGVEEELRIVLDEDLPDVLARMDLVVQEHAGLAITDFKTSRSRWSPDKAIESAEQLLLYAMAVRQRRGATVDPVNLQFAVLTKAKRSPVVQILPVPADADRTAAMKQSVAVVWDAIQGGSFYPNPSPMNCSSCPFRSRCPVFGGK